MITNAFELAIGVLRYKRKCYGMYEEARKRNTSHAKVDYDERRKELDAAILLLEKFGSKYPPDGFKSKDGKLYAHTDGSVHESIPIDDSLCSECSMDYDCKDNCEHGMMFKLIGNRTELMHGKKEPT